MMKKIQEALHRLRLLPGYVNSLRKHTEQHKLLSASLNIHLNREKEQEILQDIQIAEFQVYSQWGDDGIIQFLVDYLEIENKNFIEFGVENYREANTRFLLINNNWSGLVMDGSEKHIKTIKNDDVYWKYDLVAKAAFITKENINQLINESGFTGEIGLLHIDIDGNDYWVWKEISTINPVIVIVEYNSVLGAEKPWTVPYKSDFYRTTAHHTNLYYGTSLLSLCDLSEEKGYHFIGSNSHGNNAYFVRKDKIKDLKVLTAAEGYVESKFKESRDENGNLTFLRGDKKLKAIKGLEMFNTRTGQIEKI